MVHLAKYETMNIRAENASPHEDMCMVFDSTLPLEVLNNLSTYREQGSFENGLDTISRLSTSLSNAIDECKLKQRNDWDITSLTHDFAQELSNLGTTLYLIGRAGYNDKRGETIAKALDKIEFRLGQYRDYKTLLNEILENEVSEDANGTRFTVPESLQRQGNIIYDYFDHLTIHHETPKGIKKIEDTEDIDKIGLSSIEKMLLGEWIKNAFQYSNSMDSKPFITIEDYTDEDDLVPTSRTMMVSDLGGCKGIVKPDDKAIEPTVKVNPSRDFNGPGNIPIGINGAGFGLTFTHMIGIYGLNGDFYFQSFDERYGDHHEQGTTVGLTYPFPLDESKFNYNIHKETK